MLGDLSRQNPNSNCESLNHYALVSNAWSSQGRLQRNRYRQQACEFCQLHQRIINSQKHPIFLPLRDTSIPSSKYIKKVVGDSNSTSFWLRRIITSTDLILTVIKAVLKDKIYLQYFVYNMLWLRSRQSLANKPFFSVELQYRDFYLILAS